MPSPPPVSLLRSALGACAKSKSLLRRIEDGRMHEDMLLTAAYYLAKEAGVHVQWAELHCSNQPLSDLVDVLKKPLDYHFHSELFIEVDGKLVRLLLGDDNVGRPELRVEAFANRRAAELATGQPHVGWKHASEDDYPPDQQGKDCLSQYVDLDALRAKLAACTLDQSTRPAPLRASIKSRL